MNIVIVNYEFPPIRAGGADGCFALAKKLALKHKVTVLTSCPKDSQFYENLAGIDVYRCRVLTPWEKPGFCPPLSLITFIPSVLFLAFRLRNKLGKVDVVNTWFAIPAGVVSRLIAKLFGAPSVLTLCGGDVYDPTKRLTPNNSAMVRFLVRRVLAAQDQVTAISTDLARRAEHDIGTNHKISVIPIGVEIHIKAVAPWREKPRPMRFVASCRLIARKGLLEVVRAFAGIDGEFQFTIMGEGQQKQELLSEVHSLGIERRVEFVGFVSEEEKQSILLNSDVFILCSHHEGQCISILEGAFCGLPIITSDNGGQTDLVKDGINGIITKVGDVESIRLAIIRMMSESETRRKMRDNTLEIVKEFSITSMANKYETLFLGLIK